MKTGVTNHTRVYITAWNAALLWALCLAFDVDVLRAAAVAVVWTGGTSLLGYATGNGWLGRRAQAFALRLIGHEAPIDDEATPPLTQAQLDAEIREINRTIGACVHGGAMLLATGRCILDATHPPVICVGCGEAVCPCPSEWTAHQERRKCATTREAQSNSMTITGA